MSVESELVGVLNVKVIGSGNRILVLSHGFGADQSIWQYILPYLVPHYKIIVFDMIFSGKVDPKNFDFERYTSLSAYAADLLAILDELQVDKCLYVGHSVSGIVGCLASIQRPELFERLILLCASPRYLNDEFYHGGLERGEVDSLYCALKSDYQAWVSGFAPLVVGVDEPSVVKDFSKTMMNMNPEIALAVAKTIFESDMRSILCDVKTSCSIIQTSKDIVVPIAVPYYMQERLGGKMNSVNILDAEGHLPQLTAQGLLLQALKQVLEGSEVELEPTQNVSI